MNKPYFWGKAAGLNADLERHTQHKRELEDKIANLESQDQSDPMVESCLQSWRQFLYLLELSRAEVVNQIGKQK